MRVIILILVFVNKQNFIQNFFLSEIQRKINLQYTFYKISFPTRSLKYFILHAKQFFNSTFNQTSIFYLQSIFDLELYSSSSSA